MAFRYLCQNGVTPLFPKSVRLSLIVECKRFCKPRKPTQYKLDWRYLEDKEYTVDPIQLPRLGGRDPDTGRKYNQRVGGGVKFDWFWVTAYPFMPKEGEIYEERSAAFMFFEVVEVRRDPYRSTFLALLAGSMGRRWTMAIDGMKAGDIYRINNTIPDIPITPKYGEAWPVGAVADGTQMCLVEFIRDAITMNELAAKQAGESLTIIGRKGDLVLVRVKYNQEFLLNKHCMGTVGRMSNPGFFEEHWGSMNMKRRMGIKQGSGLWHKRDGYYGRKPKKTLPPLLVERLPPPPERYVTTLKPKDISFHFGVAELNPVLKGG